MIAKAKTYKRDEIFARYLKDIPGYRNQQIINAHDFSKKLNEGEFLALPWKLIIACTFDDARRTLFFAHTNQHQLINKRNKKNHTGELRFSPLIAEKAYYFRIFCVLLKACDDKLANFLREYFEIQKWVGGNQQAKIDNTHLDKVVKWLDKNSDSPIKKFLTDYTEKDVHIEISKIANEVKHRWPEFYRGEGVKPTLPRRYKRTDRHGRKEQGLEIGSGYPSKSLDADIKKGVRVLNAFAETCNEIDEVLPSKIYPHCVVAFSGW